MDKELRQPYRLPRPRGAAPGEVPAVKARIGRGALNTVRAALQLHGAIGYTDEHDIGIYYKRAVTLAAKYGNEITHVGRFSELTTQPNRIAV